MEIERKYLIKKLPEDLAQYPHMEMEQAYLCTEPVVRVRKEGEDYVLTYKSKGLMVREEYNLPLTAEAYAHLREKADGKLITKRQNARRIATGQLFVFDRIGVLNVEQHHVGLVEHGIELLGMLRVKRIAAAVQAGMYTPIGIVVHGAEQVG